MLIEEFSEIINLTISLVAGNLKELLFLSNQELIHLMQWVRIHFGENVSTNFRAFSRTQTETSFPSAFANCLTLIAEDRPEGPPPIIRTSYSMTSRSTCSFIIHLFGLIIKI